MLAKAYLCHAARRGCVVRNRRGGSYPRATSLGDRRRAARHCGPRSARADLCGHPAPRTAFGAGQRGHQPGAGRPAQGGRGARSADGGGVSCHHRAMSRRKLWPTACCLASCPSRGDCSRCVASCPSCWRPVIEAMARWSYRPPTSRKARSCRESGWLEPPPLARWCAISGTGPLQTLRCRIEVEPRAIAAAFFDLADVIGQEQARRALEVAAAGGHHLLFLGPPGAGKSMLARRLPGILPSMNPEEALETTCIYSVSTRVPRPSGLLSRRPFRAPAPHDLGGRIDRRWCESAAGRGITRP